VNGRGQCRTHLMEVQLRQLGQQCGLNDVHVSKRSNCTDHPVGPCQADQGVPKECSKRSATLNSTQVGASQPIERSRKRTLKLPQPVKVGHPGRANKAVPAGWIRRIVDARFAMQ
jgi:hypothetical protein